MTLEEAVAVVADPDADPTLLAEIAYEYPQSREAVAVHPRAYAELRTWIASAGELAPMQHVDAVRSAPPHHPYVPSEWVHEVDPGRSRPVASWVLVGATIAVNFLLDGPLATLIPGGVVSSVAFTVLTTAAIVVAVLLLPDQRGRRLVGAMIVGLVLLVQSVVALVLRSAIVGAQGLSTYVQWSTWSWVVAAGLLVLSWLIARARPPLTYLLAVVAALVQIGMNALVSAVLPPLEQQLHLTTSTLDLVVAASGLIVNVILAGICFLAAAPFWGPQSSSGVRAGAQP